jgi:autotransporter passenger strand-loop-strand repeat protein
MTDALAAGSIAFTGFNADGDDGLAFVSFSDIKAGTVIHFTDNAWNGSSFASDESVWSWTATTDVAAGTIISMSGLGAGGSASSNIGTVAFDTANMRDIADLNEVIYAYTGDASNPVFLTAITNSIFNASLGRGTLNGTGLTNGVNAKQMSTSPDIAVYVGDRSSLASIEDYKKSIYATANWQLQGGNDDQSQDGTTPDLPFSTQAFTADPTAQKIEFASVTASVTEGDSGDTVLTLTLTRIGSTAGVTTFSGTVGNASGMYGYANADDFGGVLPTFSGSFADGASTATVTLHISGDTTYEPDEHFFARLDAVASAGGLIYIGDKAVVDTTIVNDDPVQFFGFAENSLTVSQTEGNAGDVRTFTFVVERTRGTDGDLSFSGVISSGFADAADFGGTAPLTFSGVIKAGESTATVTITTSGDVTLEGNDTFALHLTDASSSTNTTIVLTSIDATGVIVNDDPLHIGAGQTITSPLTLADGDHLTVDQGGALAVPDPQDGSNAGAIVWSGGAVIVDNAGGIGLDGTNYRVASANDVTGSFAFNNAATGATWGSIQFRSLGSGSVVSVNNAGLMNGGVDYALDFTDVGKVATVTVNNLAGGIITNGQANSDVVRGGANMVLNNSGIIRSAADDAANGHYGGDAVDYTGSTGGIVHNFAGGLIEASRHAVTNKKGITVINDAGGNLIGRNGSGVNVDNDGNVANTVYITNHGTIIGASAGYDDSDGDAIDADGLVKLDNYGLVAGVGANGYHNGEVNVSEGAAIGGGEINNYADGSIYGYGRAIQVDDSSNGAALGATTIYNEGLIWGEGHGPEGVDPADAAAMNARIAGREAIDILGSFADTITNKGTILGGIFTDGGADLLDNSGLIVARGGAAIDLGDGDDTSTNSGIVSGDVLLGAGDDVLNLVTGSTIAGLIDGGDGTDTINLSGDGLGSVGVVANVEKLLVEGGTWSVADSARGFSNIVIKGGAAVASAIQISNTDTLQIEQGGKLAARLDFTNDASNTTSVLALDNAGEISVTAVTAVALQLSSLDTKVTLRNAEGGVIQSGAGSSKAGTINVGAIPAIAPTADVQIDNAGLIASGGVAIYANNFGGDEFVLNNFDTGVIRGGAAGATLVGWIDTVNNAGRIEGGLDGFSYDRNPNATFNNLVGGHIEGNRHAITGKGGARIDNAAGATMVGRNGSAVNVDNNASVANTVYVTNHGVMDGRSANAADSDGDGIDVDGLLALDNFGQVRGLGANGYHNGEANVSEGVAIGGGIINNYAGATIYGFGRAIQVDNSANGPASAETTIDNEGLIWGDGFGPTSVSEGDTAAMIAKIVGREAINIVGSFDDTITNKGTILGGVFADGGDDTLMNSGLMVAKGGAAVDLGGGDDSFTNSGIVSGDVLLGAGDDTINLVAGSTVSGIVDGGAGGDTLILSGMGEGTLGRGTGIENVDVQSGTWAIDNDGGFSDVTVQSGAALVVRGAISSGIVEGGAVLSVFGRADNVTLHGEQAVQSGGVATDTTIEAGGEQRVINGAAANGTTIEGGTQHVYGTADDTTVGAAGLQHVNGSATDTVVNDGGEQNVYAGATAIGTTLNTGGLQIDWGTTIATTIAGGSQYVYGIAADTVILSGTQYVGVGGASYGALIGSGTLHAFAGASVHNVTFAGADATLVLDQASGFSGFLSGWQDGNQLDLGDIEFGETTTIAYVANDGNTGGKLTVSDGSHSVSLALLGQYTAADFALANDGQGGSLISDPGGQVQTQLVVEHA